MGKIIRQSIQNTVISYLGAALGFVSTILLYPQILRAEQYGLTQLLLSIALVASQFTHLGFKNTIIRFFPYFKHSKESRSRLLSLAFFVPILGFTLFVLFYFLSKNLFLAQYADQSALFANYYLYLIPLVFGILYFQVFNNYVRALQDSVTGSFIHEIILRLTIILLLVVYLFRFISFNQFMIGFVICYCLQPIILLGYLYKKDELNITIPDLKKRSKFLKVMGTYGLYSFLGGLATLIVGKIDIIMLGAMLNLESTAVYAIAFYVGSVITIPQKSILKIANPILADILKEKQLSRVSSLYKQTSLNQIIGGALLYVGIWANMGNLMGLLPPQYQGGKWVILVIGFAKLFDMATGINGGIILNSKYYRFDLYATLFLIVIAITSNYLLIPIYGILGAALATALSVITYNTIKVVYVWIKFRMQPFQKESPLIVIIAAACLMISFQIPYLYNFIIDVTIRSLTITVLFIGSILIFNLSDDVQNLVTETIKRGKIFLSK